MEKGGKESRKMMETEIGQNQWQTEDSEDDCAIPLSFISQTKLHELKLEIDWLVLNPRRRR